MVTTFLSAAARGYGRAAPSPASLSAASVAAVCFGIPTPSASPSAPADPVPLSAGAAAPAGRAPARRNLDTPEKADLGAWLAVAAGSLGALMATLDDPEAGGEADFG